MQETQEMGSIPESPGEGNGSPLQYLAREVPWIEELTSPWGRSTITLKC